MGGKKILIVDDEVDFTQNLKYMFEMMGCEAYAAVDTEEGWRLFHEVGPDSCVIDVHLTGSDHDGIEFLQMIRQANKTIRCVILSCEDDVRCRKAADAAGVAGYVEKPVIDYKSFIDFVIGE